MRLQTGPRSSALLSLAAGGLAAIAQPPFGFLPGLLGYALLLHLVDNAPGPRPLRAAFWRGWLCAFAYFLIGCWWVAEAFLVDARQAWMAPFAVCLLPMGLGLFWGAAMVLYRILRPQTPLRILVFAFALTGAEWLRGHVLTGFPWNLPGVTWRAGGPISQSASLIGAHGLTWLTLAVSGAFAALLWPAGRRTRFIPPVAALCVLTVLWAWGAARLRHTVATGPSAIRVRIVQPDVKEEAKYNYDNLRSIFGQYVRLTAQPSAQAPDVVVWSEGAVPMSANDMLEPGGGWAEAVAGALHPGETLLFGGYRESPGPGGDRYYNSLVAVRRTDGQQPGDQLRITGVYDKYRLVPFGEFLPAESLLKPLGFEDLTHFTGSFAAGPRPAPIAPAGVPPVQPLICYESLFPDLVRDAVRRAKVRPKWIVNVSNDSWFGVTSGPLQHLNQASYRAIEEGMPIVRATPTGVSAVIDAYGRVVPGAKLGLGRAGVIDAALPSALPDTTYGRSGEGPMLVMMLGSLAAAGWRRWSRLE